MKLSDTDRHGLIELLHRIYEKIRPLEQQNGLLFGGHDLRPRIEFFHDAIRAYASNEAQHFEAGGRLSIERLAYDVSALRYVQQKPLANLSEPAGAAGTALTQRKAGNTRQLKDTLAEYYQQYGVLFTALLKPLADRDFLDRKDALNAQFEQCTEMAGALDAGASLHHLIILAQHVDDPELREEILKLIKNKQKPELNDTLNDAAQRSDHQLKTMDEAHGRFSLAQLAMYEAGRDVVKEFSTRGLNLAGRFVQDAMDQAQHGTSRSR